MLLITNNDKAEEQYKETMDVIYLEDGSYLDVLYQIRDHVHKGFRLLTHPLVGSMKPNQTPYRSVLLEDKDTNQEECFQSVMLIENSIETAQKFMKNRSMPNWSLKVREDFKTVDLSFLAANKKSYL